MKIFWHSPPQITEFTITTWTLKSGWLAFVINTLGKTKSYTCCCRNHPWKSQAVRSLGAEGEVERFRLVRPLLVKTKVSRLSCSLWTEVSHLPILTEADIARAHLWSPVASEDNSCHNGLLPQAPVSGCLGVFSVTAASWAHKQDQPQNKTRWLALKRWGLGVGGSVW